MRTVLAQTKKSNTHYLDSVDKAKLGRVIEQKKQKKSENNSNSGGANSNNNGGKEIKKSARDQFEEARKRFRQRQNVKRSFEEAEILTKVSLNDHL